jgi:hypothetical protein
MLYLLEKLQITYSYSNLFNCNTWKTKRWILSCIYTDYPQDKTVIYQNILCRLR